MIIIPLSYNLKSQHSLFGWVALEQFFGDSLRFALVEQEIEGKQNWF